MKNRLQNISASRKKLECDYEYMLYISSLWNLLCLLLTVLCPELTTMCLFVCER